MSCARRHKLAALGHPIGSGPVFSSLARTCDSQEYDSTRESYSGTCQLGSDLRSARYDSTRVSYPRTRKFNARDPRVVQVGASSSDILMERAP
eukprot:5997561-Karenia_brevis.AAC.1